MTAMPPLALLAGGLATRMRPLTEKVPKSMLDVAGEPFIAHQLRLFAREGIGRVVVCAGFLGEMIEAFVGDGARFGLEVAYSFDGPRLLGTGGALKKAAPLLGPEFLICYGDSYLDADYSAIVAAYRRQSTLGIMTVFRNEGSWDTSNIEFADGHILAYDKKNRTERMHHIDWGLGVIAARVLDSWGQDEAFDLELVYRGLLKSRQLGAYEVYNRFYEIGSPAGLLETSALLSARFGKT